MPTQQGPWIEVKQSSQSNKYQHEDVGSDPKNPWQAMFACQIGIKPYEERLKLKWGFSPAFLLEEALDRQKLFIESQLSNNPIDGQSEHRTLALRCIGIPESGLRLGLVAKVLAETEEKAHLFALNYQREIEAIFPYDYTVCPATSMEDFNRISGRQILATSNNQTSVAQIRRFEQPLQTSKGAFRVIGLWQTAMRSDEQIWRALAKHPREVLLNITLCPATFLEGDRRTLLGMKQVAKSAQDKTVNEPYLQNYDAWIDPYIDRYASPWNKYFYMQVHLASSLNIDEYLFRSIGSAITRDNTELATPGFQIVRPSSHNEAIDWCMHLENLEFIHLSNNLFLPKLSELANLEEAHAVFRFPYPPELDLPNTVFLEN